MRAWRPVFAFAALSLMLAGCGDSSAGNDDSPSADTTAAGPWSFTDASGEVVKAGKTPTRIIAHGGEAAALMSFGIKPVGIYADESVKTDPNLKNLDLSGIEILGEEWGKIDVEKAVALRPDLIVGDWWPAEKAHSGLEEGVDEKSKKLTVGAVSPADDKLYFANPEHAPELLDLQSWGLKVIKPDSPDPGFPYWENLSWENADKYQPDLILFDGRSFTRASNAEWGKKQPTWFKIKAAKDGAVVSWPAYWLHTYGDFATELDKLTEAVTAADPNIGD